MFDKLSDQQLENDLKALEEMTASRGWTLLMEVLQGDLLASCVAMGQSPDMSESRLRFQVGAIYAANNLITAPARIAEQMKTELTMRSALKPKTKEKT